MKSTHDAIPDDGMLGQDALTTILAIMGLVERMRQAYGRDVVDAAIVIATVRVERLAARDARRGWRDEVEQWLDGQGLDGGMS